jgi:hypothetical protein
MTLQKVLNKFELTIKDKEPIILSYLNNGLSKDEIYDKLRFLNREIPEDLICLYQWRNGLNSKLTRNGLIMLDGYFMDLDLSIKVYNADKEHYWNNHFFPIFSGGDQLLLLGIDKNHPSFNKIYFFDLSPSAFIRFDKYLISYYDTLESLFISVVNCFEKGAYSLDKETETLKIEWELMWSINKECNPSSEHWKDQLS